MSAPAKSIAKSKPAKSLLELTAESVIKQSIEQGKSKDIIAMLEANPEGRQALARYAPRPKEVICVVIVGPDGPTEGTVGFLPAEKARWFMELLDEYESRNKIKEKDNPAWRSALGGVALQWQEVAEASEWATDTLGHLDNDTVREIVEGTLGLTIEADEEEEEERDDEVDVDEWVDNHATEIDEAFQLKLEELFDESHLVSATSKSRLLTPEQADALMARGQLKTRVTVTIDTSSWS